MAIWDGFGQYPLNIYNSTINKPGENIFRLQFQSTEEATAVRKSKIDWNTAYLGVQTPKPKYGIVIHGVPVEAINLNEDYEDTKREWETTNSEKKIEITEITLRRQEKYKPTVHRSLH